MAIPPHLKDLLGNKAPEEMISAIGTHWDPSKHTIRSQPEEYMGRFEDVLNLLPPPVRSVIQKHHGKGVNFLGGGSSRAVFDVGKGAALKVALNSAGQSQNKNEASIGRTPGTEDLIPRVLQLDDKTWRWIVVEKVGPMPSSELEDLLQIRTKTRKGMVVNGPRLVSALLDDNPYDFQNAYADSLSPFQKRVVDLVRSHNLAPGDLENHHNWGKSLKDGRPLILDPGLTSETWKDNYA